MREKSIIEINLGNFGSTGSIMRGIAKEAKEHNYSVYQAYPGGDKNSPALTDDILICSSFYKKMVRYLASISGYNGCFSIVATVLFLQRLKKYKPGLLHFHNLHDSYINLPLLFSYVKRHNIPVIWTLHDCWSFTGKCPHFVNVHCDKWITGCSHCSSLGTYPVTKRDKTAYLWKHKKKWFSNVKNLTIVTPSKWLAGLVKKSYLKDYPVFVINNGIDLNTFKPTSSNFREKYKIKNEFIVLGVSFEWSQLKGLDIFIELAKRLNENYKIVLVGTDNKVRSTLPGNVIAIDKTNDQRELIDIYSSSTVFLNPTRQDTFPTVNMEALACGLPVITFNTGGSPEIIDNKSGIVCEDNIDSVINAIRNICEKEAISRIDCIDRAKAFSKNDKYSQYLDLYAQKIQC